MVDPNNAHWTRTNVQTPASPLASSAIMDPNPAVLYPKPYGGLKK